MLVLLRVVRASVWLSSLALARQDGVLALVKTAASSHVVYGAPEETEAPQSGSTKRWAMVPIRYNETPRETRPVDVEITDIADDKAATATSPDPRGEVEIVLFLLSNDSDRKGGKQRITYLASSTLRLSATDLEAVDGAREVLFKSCFDGDLGTVEIAVQRADGSTSGGRLTDDRGDGGDGGGGAFSVQWTSSEALERDLAAKERARVDAEQKLLERLTSAEASARRARALRDQVLELVSRKHAAKAIQRGFRAWRRRRRERKRQLRREQEERERLRKQKLRDKVVERNQRRTQRLIEQWTAAPSVQETKEDRACTDHVSELSVWMEMQREATNSKLATTLARLKRERDEKLRGLRSDHRVRFDEAVEDEDSPSRLLSDGLIHAIQRLHLRK